MAYTNLSDLFKGICDAIRAKKGTTGAISHQDIPAEIAAIQTGITPSGTKSITANGSNIDVNSYQYANVNVPIPNGYVYPNVTRYDTEATISPGDFQQFASGTYLPNGFTVNASSVTSSVYHKWFNDMSGAYNKAQCRFNDITEDEFNRLQFLIIRGYAGVDFMDLYNNGRIMYAIVHVKEGYISTSQGKNQYAEEDNKSTNANMDNMYASDGKFSFTYHSNGYVKLEIDSDYCWFDTSLTYVVEGILVE